MKGLVWIILIFVIGFLFFEASPTYTKKSCEIDSNEPITIKFGLPWKNTSCTYEGFFWDKSIWERLTIKQEKPLGSPEIKILLNTDCVKYFDGCNTCTVENKKISCTKKQCETYKEVKCLEYLTDR